MRHRVVRMLLAAVVDCDPALGLAVWAKDANEAISLAAPVSPDAVLLGVEMPGGGGSRAACTSASERARN